MEITDWSAAELSESIHRREVSCREVMTAYLDRIDDANPAVNAIVSIRDRDDLLKESAARDEDIARDESRGWMHGLPQAIKDLSLTKGVRTTMGSRLL
ncbi:MAG TPA: amidase family protein, partial [Ilumatobacteraceae bacterium]